LYDPSPITDRLGAIFHSLTALRVHAPISSAMSDPPQSAMAAASGLLPPCIALASAPLLLDLSFPRAGDFAADAPPDDPPPAVLPAARSVVCDASLSPPPPAVIAVRPVTWPADVLAHGLPAPLPNAAQDPVPASAASAADAVPSPVAAPSDTA